MLCIAAYPPRRRSVLSSPHSPKIPPPPALPRITLEGSPIAPSPPSRKSTAFAYWLAHLQVSRPSVPLLITALLTVISLALASRLHMRTGFESLLPEDRPSVKELDRVAAKTAGVSTVFVVLEGHGKATTQALRKAADALVPELEKVGAPWVGSAESGVHEAYKFLGPRAGLYADLAKLEKLRDDVDARFEYEVGKAAGTRLDDDDVPPPIDSATLKKSFGLQETELERYPDGYYQ